MIKYRILKELPWLEIGEIITADKVDFDLYYLKENWWIKEQKSIYKLEYGDDYYYLNDYQKIENNFWHWYTTDKQRLEVWNVFLIKEEAEKELKKRKALVKIKRWIWENKIELGNYNYNWYIILIENWNKKLFVEESYSFGIWDIIFKNTKDAEKCLSECEQDWNILFDFITKDE